MGESYGIILFALFTGKLPKQSLKERLDKVPIKFPKPSSKITKYCISLIKKCTSFNPDERPSFAEIFEIMKKNNYDLFSDRKKGKLTGKKLNMKRFIEKRILKIEAFEYQHQDE